MALIDIIVGNKKTTETKAMKRGKALEPHAFRKYISLMTKSCQHKNFECKNVGLVIHKTEPYIAVSPDGEIVCDCCGVGVLEIKSLMTSISDIPNHNH